MGFGRAAHGDLRSFASRARLGAVAVVLVATAYAPLLAADGTPVASDDAGASALAPEDGDAAAVAASEGHVVREGGSLHISTAHGVVTLVDDDSDLSEDYHVYRYEGRLPRTPFHAVHISYFESPGYVLVHEISGRQCTVDARPVVSPSGKFLAIGSLDLEAMMSPNVLTVHEVSGDSLVTSWTEEPLDWGPQELHWVDDKTLRLTRVVATDRGPGDYDRVGATLVHGDSGWNLTDVTAKVGQVKD